MRGFAFFFPILTTTLISCSSMPRECESTRFSELGYAAAKVGKDAHHELVAQCGDQAEKDFQAGVAKGRAEFCSKDRIEKSGEALGAQGLPPEFSSVQSFQTCDDADGLLAVYQASHARGAQKYEEELKRFCTPEQAGREGYLRGLRGDTEQVIATRLERCNPDLQTHLLVAYEQNYAAGLKIFCRTDSLRQSAIREAQMGGEGRLPDNLQICHDTHPDLENKFLSLFRKERARFVTSHCTKEAGFANGAADAKLLTEHRGSQFPAFCDDESFEKYRDGYLNGWKNEKDALCSYSKAYDRGIKDAQAARDMKIEVPDACPPDYKASMVRRYREGYLYFRNRVGGALIPVNPDSGAE